MGAHHRPTILRSAAACAAAGALALTMTTTAGTATGAAPRTAHPAAAHHDKVADYDARQSGSTLQGTSLRRLRTVAHPERGVVRLRQHLGDQGIVSVDPLTGTPRLVAKVNGYLTGRSARPATRVAMTYVRHHPAVFNLSHHALASLTLRRAVTDSAGMRNLSYVQKVRGIPVFGNGLRAHVTRAGRLMQVDGAPLSRLPRHVGNPKISAARARQLALRESAPTPGPSFPSLLDRRS